MKLTRHQADLVLRHYTAEYAERTDKASGFRTLAELGTFVRELQWRIDANLDGGSVNHLLDLWSEWMNAHTQDEVGYWEGEINVTVNALLDAANFRPPHILRYSVAVSA